jgi:hypothetical protein
MMANRGVYGANTPQVKNGNNASVGGERCGCEARNTHMCGAEAGEVNEMK